MATPKFIHERAPRHMNRNLKSQVKPLGAHYRRPRKTMDDTPCIRIQMGSAVITLRDQQALDRWMKKYPGKVQVISCPTVP